MRLTFTEEEYNELKEFLIDNGGHELSNLLHKKFKESLPTKEGYNNKIEGIKTTHKKNKMKSSNKIDLTIKELTRRKEKITISSVSKESGLSYNTVKQYKVRIDLAAFDLKNIIEQV